MKRAFSSREVRKIVGISQRKLDYWAEQQVVRPSIQEPDGKGTERRYSYHDMLKLAVVKRLRDNDLSLQKIRRAIEKLSRSWPRKDPLLNHTLVTDGRRLHRVTDDPAVLEDILSCGQLAFSIVLLGKVESAVHQRVLSLVRKAKAVI